MKGSGQLNQVPVAELSMEHVYIRPRTPQLNGKVERSHRTDREEFSRLLTYRNAVNLGKKLAAWEGFYNFDRPHGTHSGKISSEVSWEKLRQRTSSGLSRNIIASYLRVRFPAMRRPARAAPRTIGPNHFAASPVSRSLRLRKTSRPRSLRISSDIIPTTPSRGIPVPSAMRTMR